MSAREWTAADEARFQATCDRLREQIEAEFAAKMRDCAHCEEPLLANTFQEPCRACRRLVCKTCHDRQGTLAAHCRGNQGAN